MLDIQTQGQPRHTQIIKSTLWYGPKRLEIDDDDDDDDEIEKENQIEHGNTQTSANHMVL